MLCEVCGIQMQQRSGKFGDFLYCVNQHLCKTKTVSIEQNVVIKDNNRFQQEVGYTNWLFNKELDILIENIAKDDLNRTYEDDEMKSVLGFDNYFYDFYAGH